MIAVWAALGVAVLALVTYAAAVSRRVVPATWPGLAPLQVRENRAHDQQLTHLARLAAADDPTAVHQVLRSVTDQLPATSYLPLADLHPATAAFLADPPVASPDRYRRELAAALTRIERM